MSGCFCKPKHEDDGNGSDGQQPGIAHRDQPRPPHTGGEGPPRPVEMPRTTIRPARVHIPRASKFAENFSADAEAGPSTVGADKSQPKGKSRVIEDPPEDAQTNPVPIVRVNQPRRKVRFAPNHPENP
ncbi:hypothetical protein EJ04DRAFT_521587 [Polyplosphaeria fusca]|uniref:Uncharacterized protein n=1 Tax=Polyplosphaeria fusca TaxID=682080 RepID=A0A9P4R1M0_9PLEO|nr:hypothetical protein EJ04DRAFT_521587 [Polyplosphaeria fusca]